MEVKTMTTQTSQPTIDSVKDSQDEAIPHNGSTSATDLSLEGSGEPASILLIFDGNTQLQPPVSVNNGGSWALPVTALALGRHIFTARTIDGSLISQPWVVTLVIAAVKPVITRVTGASGEVSIGGITRDSTLTLHGTSSNAASVEILDSGTPQEPVQASSGEWQAELRELALGAHVFTAQSDGLTSEPWPLVIEQAYPPLIIDQTPLVLGGLVRTLAVPSSPPPGSYGQRWPSSGVPPYTYSNPDGRVDAQNNGLIISRRNGAGTVTVTDSVGQTTSFPVQVSGVLELDGWNGTNIFRICSQNAANYGGRLPSIEEWHALRGAYSNAPVFENSYVAAWSSSSAGGIQKHCIVPTTGAASTQPDQGYIIGGRGSAAGWAVVNNR
jgi:hypothetical protein